ncbi:mannitol dehydrogenase family protein [Arthrobacter sp. zg-Y769]|uniref:mannitol dehydrogenase family protein n=1 Tax=Arthrobacter sp. zg-Y769 TaxID=2894191 RepID=UPI001E53ADFB|nr:mannitol dehydrogenase family protein [Arthrobacter sp. zg-Y769]MCC9205570.1 mannitol dehydrogenase family protein [Arthrobacter sp. zg-Y769]
MSTAKATAVQSSSSAIKPGGHRAASRAALLTRTSPPPPIRIVHLGLGAFHRSHQAWFTWHAPDAQEWGIAAFTGRRPDAALALSQQGCLYTLVERDADGDSLEIIGSISEAHDGADTARLGELLSASSTAIVTLTITEAAYDLDGSNTPLVRLVDGLRLRQASGAGPIAVVSCDNVPSNGKITGEAVLRIAERDDDTELSLTTWIKENVSFVNTSVDRITPRVTKQDISDIEQRERYRDESPVIAEPFKSWVLSGGFPAGRPAWESAGAQFVDDITPYENRKLWLLNGAHSILAYTGQLRGHHTVAEALADPGCSEPVNRFWDEAQRHLPAQELDIAAYRTALLRRFQNARISHRLEQIAVDATTKLRMRIVPVLLAERAAGRAGLAAAFALAAWIDFVAHHGSAQDPQSEQVGDASSLKGLDRTAALLALLEPSLATDAAIVHEVHSLQEISFDE